MKYYALRMLQVGKGGYKGLLPPSSEDTAMNYADAPDEIIVPEEALAAPVEGPVSVPDLSGAMQAPQ
jgi:hypothetical protein